MFAGSGGSVASAQESPGQSIKPPINFPPNYKGRIAALLVPDYVDYSGGQPEISNVQTSTGPLGGGVSVCVQFPLKKPDLKYITLIFGE
jgi:hypothetical protein